MDSKKTREEVSRAYAQALTSSTGCGWGCGTAEPRAPVTQLAG
jgi:hypothetical protein